MQHTRTFRALLASTVLATIPLVGHAQMREGQRAGDAPGMNSVQNQQGQPAGNNPEMRGAPGGRVGASGTPSNSGSPIGVGTGPALTGSATGSVVGGQAGNQLGVAMPAQQSALPGTGTNTAPRSDATNANTGPGLTGSSNPPGTAATRALDNAAGTNTSGANPQNRDGTPGNPPGTAATRALDNAAGTNTSGTNPPGRDGTAANPPGTAAERSLDRNAGTNTSGAFPQNRDGGPNNPPGTAVGRAVDGATSGAATTSTGGTTPAVRPGTVTGPTGAATATQAAMTGNFAERPRVSQIIGSRVYNDANESIGEVDDVLLMQGSAAPMAVIQIGGFLGIGGRMVSIPLTDLAWNQERERWVLRSATKEQLQQRPEFQYSQLRRS